MPTTASKILEIARAEIGVTESPAGSNRVKYNTAYYGRAVSGSDYPWCCAFVWWVFRQAGAAELFFGGKKTAYCPTLKAHHKAQAVTNYRAGDVVFFNFNKKGNAAHVGICESATACYITTIDGNTGTGNEANGGAVMRRRRHKKYVVGAYRPDYPEETNPWPVPTRALTKGRRGNEVRWLQWELARCGHPCAVDGSFGAETEQALRAYQEAAGLEPDGSCGSASRAKLLGG